MNLVTIYLHGFLTLFANPSMHEPKTIGQNTTLLINKKNTNNNNIIYTGQISLSLKANS